MSQHEATFWRERDEYHQLAKKYDDDMTYDHPGILSGRSPRGLDWCNCSWCATRVEYPRYAGEALSAKKQ